MDSGSAFKPFGPAVALLASTTAPSGTLVNLTGDWALLAFNRSTSVDAYLAYGSSSGAVASAVVPVVGSPGGTTQNVIPLPRGTIQTFTFSGPTFLAGVTGSGNTIIDITTGALGGA